MRGDPKKLDQGKLMWDLLPYDAVEQIVDILTFGAEKYGADSWKTVDDAKNRYFAALMRHLVEYKKGNLIDDESGKSHLAHAATNAIFLLWLNKNSDDTIHCAECCKCEILVPFEIVHRHWSGNYCNDCYETYAKKMDSDDKCYCNDYYSESFIKDK